MNIFVLDPDLLESARAHCNKHIVKMPLEAAQIACSALPSYKPTHLKHPCTVWAAESEAALNYTINYGLALCSEFATRYRKQHAARNVLVALGEDLRYSGELPKLFAPAMAIEYRSSAFAPRMELAPVVAEYRRYYILAKADFAVWPTSPPSWFTPESLL
jgi:hypothetical protein